MIWLECNGDSIFLMDGMGCKHKHLASTCTLYCKSMMNNTRLGLFKREKDGTEIVRHMPLHKGCLTARRNSIQCQAIYYTLLQSAKGITTGSILPSTSMVAS